MSDPIENIIDGYHARQEREAEKVERFILENWKEIEELAAVYVMEAVVAEFLGRQRGGQPPDGAVSHPVKQSRNCPVCGRFVRSDGRCVKLFWDDYHGAWDHA